MEKWKKWKSGKVSGQVEWAGSTQLALWVLFHSLSVLASRFDGFGKDARKLARFLKQRPVVTNARFAQVPEVIGTLVRLFEYDAEL